MAVLRQTGWIDGDDFPDEQDDLQALLDAALLKPGCCVVCGTEQPDDLRWPAFAVELRSKADGSSSGDVTFATCPEHEARLDRLLTQLGG